MSDDVVEIYSDGSCLGNPGPGGWGALLRWRGHEREMSGSEAETTNNRMELTAAIEALKAKKKPSKVILTTDSRYVIQGINEWMPNWVARGWKTANKQPVKNQDLWQALHQQVQNHDIQWQWVKGHDGHDENERVDDLARLAAEARQSEI